MLSFVNHRQKIAYFLCLAFIVALFASKFVMTLVMIAILALVVLDVRWDSNVDKWRKNGSSPFFAKLLRVLNPDLPKLLQNFIQNKVFLAITSIFFLVLLSGIYSSEIPYWLERMRIKLPFLVMPFAFLSFPAFSKRQYYSILYFFVLALFLVSLWTGYNYYIDFDAINLSIGRGKAIPTPINYIRFSLLMAFGILVSAYLVKEKFYLKFKWESYLLFSISVFLFLFIHILSVRTGLLVLYLVLAVLVMRYIYTSRNLILGVIILGALVLLPIFAYNFIPSFQQKINFSYWDLTKYKEGVYQNHSDSERIVSLKIGLEIGNRQALIGTGMGDVKSDIQAVYQDKYPGLSWKLPHNQFVFFYASAGMLGVLWFGFSFLYPLLYRQQYKNVLFLSIHIILFFSFMMETTIETAIGTSIYVFFILLSLNYFEGKNSHNEIMDTL